MEIKKDNSQMPAVDIRHRVMRRIKEEGIEMKHPLIFLAKKLALQSTLILAILSGAFVVSSILYLLKKTGALAFLTMGLSGVGAFIHSFPYDFLSLFIVTVFLGNYILKGLYSSNGLAPSRIMAIILFILTIAIGFFFFASGVSNMVK